MPVNILIVGATGKQGGKTISTLLESRNSTSELSLRFLTRNPESPAAKALAAKGAQPIKGDLLDKEALRKALDGVERAFLVTDSLVGEEKAKEQGVGFVDIAKEAGVKHLVFTSVCAADLAPSVPHFRYKAEVEKHLKESGISYTILRPVAFMDNFPTQPSLARTFGIGGFFAFSGYKPCAFIATQDIGVFAGKALLDPTNPTFKNTTIDLSAGTYDLEGVRAAIQKSQGYSPWLATYFPKIVRRVLPYDFRMMFEYFEKGGYPEVDTAKLRQIHPGLMSMEDYFKQGA